MGKPMNPAPCIHRGSQRRIGCCGGKAISRYVCREIKQSDGATPVDCIPTERVNIAIKDSSPSAMHEKWDELVKVCEKCPLYRAK